MTAALEILKPGLATTLQDLGRTGLQRYGVPVSGALDPLALELANALVGNPPGSAALEILSMGPTFRVDAQSVRLAIAGSEVGLRVGAAAVPARRSVTVPRDAEVTVPGFTDAACCYLAVEGGFDIEPVMGSFSTYVRGGFGGFEGRLLQPGDRLPLARAAASAGLERRAGEIDYGDGPIRVVPGPQEGWFEPQSVARFFEEPYEITAQSDRMGMRLQGPELRHSRGFNIVSDGIATGAIQVPGTGLPIVLLADHQTVGGYPKIGTVASADLPRLGRLRPGQQIRFKCVTAEEAEALRLAQAEAFARLLAALAPLTALPSTEELLESNLIGGVVYARP